MHKYPIKNAHRSAQNLKKNLGGDPLNPPVERGINHPLVSSALDVIWLLVGRKKPLYLRVCHSGSYEMYFPLPFHLTIQLFKAGWNYWNVSLQTYTQTADAGVSNRLKKVIQIDLLLTLYELIEFCLLVIYNKPGVVQYVLIAGHRFLLKKLHFFLWTSYLYK